MTESMIGCGTTEDFLRESLGMYEDLVATIPVAVYRFRMKALGGWQFDFVNGRFCELTGLSRENILNDYETVFRLIHPDDLPAFISLIESAEKNPALFAWEGRIIVDGQSLWMGVESRPTVMDNGDLVWSGHFTDITDRKKAQEGLRLSETQKSAILNGIGANIAFVNDKLEILWVNRTSAESVGRSLEEIIGATCHSLWANPERPCENCPTIKAFQTRQSQKAIMTTPDGRVWDERGEPVFDDQGNLIGVVELAQDITERTRMEVNLRDSESRLRSLAETMPDALVVYDDLGRVTFANKAFEELYGWSTEELVGKTITNFVPPAENEITSYNWERTLRGEKAVFETQRWTKDGKVLDMQISTSTLRNIYGKHTASIVVHHDITARKREQEKLHNSERTLNTILDTSPVGIGLVLDRKLKWVNDACLKMFGFENQEEVVGQSTSIFYPSEKEYERAGRYLYTDMQSGKIAETVTMFRQKDGSIFDARVRMRTVDPSSSENLMIFVVTDISDQLRAEQEKLDLQTQLFQSQKIEALGTLVGGIAHDFNNMLQVVIGYSDLLLSDKRKGELCQNELRTIIETAKGGADLVTKLLAFGQQSPIFPVNLDLNHQISQLTSLISRTLPQVVSIDVDLSDEPTTIHADPNQIDQILMNLAINASEAMPDGGRLKISTGTGSFNDECCSVCHGVKRGSYVMLSVTDTGRGMDKETLSRIFEPFFSTKQRGSTRGTGLGLSVVQGIAQQHGGHVTCKSEQGKGTEFKIYFPAIEETLMTIEAVAPTVQSGGSETILVVEDSMPVAELEERFLTDAGYNIIVATNGREALDIYQSRKEEISLVVLDLLMPEMSGRDCLMELVKINPSVKMIIATGYSPEDELHREIRPLVKGFLHKPFSMPELLSSVRSVMGTD